MKKFIITIILVLAMALSVTTSYATDTTKILTFQWEQADTTNLTEWKLFWSDTSGPPYAELAVISYSGEGGPIYTSPQEAIVSGNQGTEVIKYFVLIACGDVPQEGGGAEYMCSVDSNEVSHGFWIPAGMFSVPFNFQIVEIP